MAWSNIVKTQSQLVLSLEQQRIKFIDYYIRHVQGVLMLIHHKSRISSDVFSDEIIMKRALEFDFKQTLPHINPKLFTVDFINYIIKLPNVDNDLLYTTCPFFNDPYNVIKFIRKTSNPMIIHKLSDKHRSNPKYMYKIVLNFPDALCATIGRARYSFLVLLASILKQNIPYAILYYKQSYHQEPEFLKTLELVLKNPNIFTLDYAFLMSIENSKELTLKCRKQSEYEEFYYKLEHDILHYNQMCIVRLCVIISIRENTGILQKLKAHGLYHYKNFMVKIFDYLDDFMYKEEITMQTLIKIASYLQLPIIVYPKKKSK